MKWLRLLARSNRPGCCDRRQANQVTTLVPVWYLRYMGAARKITVEVPVELLERAQQASGTGVTRPFVPVCNS